MVYTTDADPRTHGAGGRRRRPPERARRACSRMDATATGVAMGRKILFVTTDQQRYDTLGCNGGTLARTPVVDGLAAAGIRYERAHPQSVVCMPSRSTMLTGQHPSHARRVDERRAAAGRRAVGGRRCCTTPATAPRSSARRTSSRSSTRSAASSENRLARATGTVGAAPRLRARRVRHARRRRPAALRALAGRDPPRGDRRLLPGARRRARGQRRAAAATPARRRCTTTRSRATGTTPTGWPIARSPGSTRSTPTTTGSAG